MAESFSENLKRLRAEKGYTQQQLAKKMFVDRSSVARWESGNRVPDLILLGRLAECLDVDPSALIKGVDLEKRAPVIIMVDDEKPILNGNLRVLSETLPDAEITGFTRPSEALRFVRANTIDIAFLDIELGKTSGFDLCEEMIRINPEMIVIFLTAYPDYSLRAWKTHASGFLVKPLVSDDIRKQLSLLRSPVNLAGTFSG